jgi:hypothetical protein
VGIPNPKATDARVNLKREYLNKRCSDNTQPFEMRKLNG